MSLGNNELSSFFNGSSSNWDGDPVTIAGVRVVPWGIDNNLPKTVRDILEKNIWDRAFWIANRFDVWSRSDALSGECSQQRTCARVVDR